MINAPAIQIPATALKRTWVSAQMADLECGLEFLQLLRKLDPAKARGLDARRPMDCYEALFQHCATFLPLFDPIFYEEYEMEEPGFTEAVQARDLGIPIDFAGVDSQDYLFSHRGPSPAIAVCLCFEGPQEMPELRLERTDVLKEYRRSLSMHINKGLQPHWTNPGPGRKWQEPWDALELLYLYAHNATDFEILNITHLMIAEGDSYPQWHVQEIRGWTKQWERARPTFERIIKFQKYIDASPGSRLPLLAGALASHKPSVEKISQPKQRGKTLAQLFSRTHK